MEDTRYYRITYSCGCGESEEYITAKDDETATQYAYESAVEDYHSFEGLHGVLSEDEIAEEMFADLYGDEDNDLPTKSETIHAKDKKEALEMAWEIFAEYDDVSVMEEDT